MKNKSLADDLRELAEKFIEQELAIIEKDKRIAELERVINQQKAYIDHALDNSKESLINRIAELEQVMFDLLSLSSFHMSFPFEAEKLEKLKGGAE